MSRPCAASSKSPPRWHRGKSAAHARGVFDSVAVDSRLPAPEDRAVVSTALPRALVLPRQRITAVC